MAMNIPWGFGFQRMAPDPLDASAVFDTLADFQTYLNGPTAYAGQIVAVKNASNVPDIYVINDDLTTYSPIGADGGGGRYEHDQTTAATEWPVIHNLGTKYVSSQVIDSAGKTIIGDIDWAGSTVSTLRLVFGKPITGTVVIRR